MHLREAKLLWIERRIAGMEAVPSAEKEEADVGLAAAVEEYRAAWARTESSPPPVSTT